MVEVFEWVEGGLEKAHVHPGLLNSGAVMPLYVTSYHLRPWRKRE